MSTKSVPLPDLDAIAWQGRPVPIVFDSDVKSKPDVRRARAALAKELARRGARVRLPELPPGPNGEKSGLDDYLRSRSSEEFQALVQAAPVWGEPKRSRGPASPDVAEETGGGSQADRLVALALADGVGLSHDQVGDTFAVVPVGGHREIWPCRGRNLKRWLAGRLWQTEGKAASTQALATALNVIEAKALFEGEEHQLHNRVAAHEGAVWYDLGDREWRAVKVTPYGWEVVASPPILFRRYSHQRPQVEPVRGGDLGELRRFVNLRDEAGLLLCQVYLVCSLVPDIPHPIPDVHGGQGAAKTTFLRVLRRLNDPSAVEVLSLPHDAAQLAQQLAHHWAPYYDNVTDLPDWVSDVLCRAATGHGFTKRELYSDDEDVIYQLRRCPGLNGINVAAQKPDLLDRVLLFELASIPRSERRPEQAFWEEFEHARPQLLGAVFDVLSRAMALHRSISLPGLPRMADFAVWGCAVARALGHHEHDFLTAYDGNMEIRNDEAIQASPVAIVLLVFMQGREAWEGTASELLAELEGLAPAQGVRTQAKEWPKAAHALTRELHRVRPNLVAVGVDIATGNAGPRRSVRIFRTAENSVYTVTSVLEAPESHPGVSGCDAIPDLPGEASPKASRDGAAPDAPGGAGDARDACDAFSLPFVGGDAGSDGPALTAQASAVALATDGRAASAVRDVATKSRSGPVTGLAPCPHCHGTRLWCHRAGGDWGCARCHPPGSEDVVAEWLDLAGEEDTDG